MNSSKRKNEQQAQISYAPGYHLEQANATNVTKANELPNLSNEDFKRLNNTILDGGVNDVEGAEATAGATYASVTAKQAPKEFPITLYNPKQGEYGIALSYLGSNPSSRLPLWRCLHPCLGSCSTWVFQGLRRPLEKEKGQICP